MSRSFETYHVYTDDQSSDDWFIRSKLLIKHKVLFSKLCFQVRLFTLHNAELHLIFILLLDSDDFAYSKRWLIWLILEGLDGVYWLENNGHFLILIRE